MSTDSGVTGYNEERALLKRYLSDEIAPLIFANNASDLFEIPTYVVASEIHSWIGDQIRGSSNMTTADLIYHAATKLHQLGMLELIPKEEINAYISRIQPNLLEICPAEQRQGLEENFSHLERSTSIGGGKVEVLHKQGGGGPGQSGGSGGQHQPAGPGGGGYAGAQGGAAPSAAGSNANAGPAAAADPASMQRLNLLLDQLQRLPASREPGAEPGAAPAGDSRVLAHVVEEVAAQAGSSKELETQLGFLQDLGVASLGSGIFQLLSQGLPDWAPPAGGDSNAESPVSAARAMRKVVKLSQDREELGKRFKELVDVAIDECNGGSLGRAVTMLDLADRMVSQNDVDSALAAAVVTQSAEQLDRKQLYAFAEDSNKASLLRRLLTFFPSLRVEPLLEALAENEDREERMEILKLLRAHGEEARQEAVSALDESVNGANQLPWHVERNLLFLMRAIPRSEEDDLEHEIDLLNRTSDIGGPTPVVRESLTSLVQMDNPRALVTVDARITELEDGLLGKAKLPIDLKEARWLHTHAFKQLALSESPQATEIVINHGLTGETELGDTYGRIAQLGSQDLSNSPEQVKRLVDALENELPRRFLGVSRKNERKSQVVEHLITAVSGTNTPLVQKTLGEIARKYTDQPFSTSAGRALEQMGSSVAEKSKSAKNLATLSGDLGLFGLPNLLQNLADSRLAGTIKIFGSGGTDLAAVELDQTILVSASYGKLSNDLAVYQLLEIPAEGRFEFHSRSESEESKSYPDDAHSVTSLLLEGMRRYDEFQRAASLVPDDARFKPANKKPSDVKEDGDPKLAKAVWTKAVRGAPPAVVEPEIGLDSFRIRRLYEHWVTEGSLVRVEDPPTAQ